MGKRHVSVQKDLFDSSQSQELQMRVRELDVMIKQALKDSNYDRARTLIQEQEKIIKELVAADDSEADQNIK